MPPAQINVTDAYSRFLESDSFPCIAAKAALNREEVRCFEAADMSCGREDETILGFLYDFVDVCRQSESLFHSAVVVFKRQENLSEELFETWMWQRLQALSDLDASRHPYDDRVSSDIRSPGFSFSL